MSLVPDRPVVVPGRTRRVVYAIRSNGKCPAREFIEALDPPDLAKVVALFVRLADHGEAAIQNRERFKELSKPVWEFKSFQIRITCYRDGSDWVLLTGFIKKKDDVPPSEIQRAVNIMNEDRARRRQPGNPKQ